MTAFRLGPLGGLREVPLVQRGVSVQSSRSESAFVTLGGRRAIQRSARAARDWVMGLGSWRTPADVAYLTACADGSIPGPLYLHTQDAALSNLLPSDVAAPCRMGTVALGSVAGAVPVGMPGGAVPMSGVVQQATAGAWSATVPVRQVPHVLSAWASAAGAAVEWRTVTAAGVQVATGTVSAAAVTGGFYGAASIAPGATVAGLQVRLAAGSLTVGGLRLVEGVRPEDGVEVRRNLRARPRTAATLPVLTAGASQAAPWGGTAPTIAQIADSSAPSGGGYATRATSTVAQTSVAGGDALVGGSLVEPVTAGETYTLSVYVRASTALTVRAQAQWLTAASASAGSTNGSNVTLVPGAWTRLWVTGAAPGTAATVRMDVDFATAQPIPAGMTLDADAVLIEQSSVLGPYFDGSTSPDSDLTPSWTGTPNASPSVLKTIPADAVTDDWLPGVGVPQVVVSDPQQTLQLVTAGDVRSDYAVTIREVG